MSIKNSFWVKFVAGLTARVLVALAITFIGNTIADAIERLQYRLKLADQMEEVISTIPKKYRKFVVELCLQERVNIWVYVRLVRVESGWNRYATGKNANGTVDRGIGQINSCNTIAFRNSYFTGNPRGFDLYNPFHNMEVSIKHLRDLNRQFRGNWKLTVSAYNAGVWAVRVGRIPKSTQRYLSLIIPAS